MAVLLITHDLNLVRRFADRVAVMEDGDIVEQGAVGDVFANPQHAYTRKLIDSRPVRDVVEAADADAAARRWCRPATCGSAIRCRLPGIRGWFRKGRFVAVKDASFHLLPGATLGVIGESGSGKSTLALAALGLLPFGGRTAGRRASPGAGTTRRTRPCAGRCRWCSRTRFRRCRRA